MPFVIESRRRQTGTLHQFYLDAPIIDVTVRANEPWIQFAPEYPHGNIPAPFSPGVFSQSVEGLWQGLKVFERAGIDRSRFEVTSMRGLARNELEFGRLLGFQAGLEAGALLDYPTAMHQIFLPAYRWVLEHPAAPLIARLRDLGADNTVVLLDDAIEVDFDNPNKPLSHARLIMWFIEDTWPAETSA